MRTTSSRIAASCLLLAGAWTGRHVSARTVRQWRGSSLPTTMAGRLRTRVVGAGSPSTVLLHGLVGSGDYYGASYDALARRGRLVVPDLLGFGGSYRAASPSGYGLEAHLDALDEMADDLRLTRPLTVAGHSMGAIIALHWAARRSTEVRKVVAMGAPLYISRAEGLSHVQRLGPLEAIMALDTGPARATCAWMCRHRTSASWVAAALNPRLPVPVARRGVLHTWPAYADAMDDVVLGSEWQVALSHLVAGGVTVVFAAGAYDPVPVPGRTAYLAKRYRTVETATSATAGHDLPLSEPGWCQLLLDPAHGSLSDS